MTLQAISDRFEITDLLTDYCSAIDIKDIDTLDHIFTEDAVIDYSQVGGPKGNLILIKKFLLDNLGDLPRQHMISNFRMRIHGDVADVRSMCHNPFELPS
jgi:SnoaL-like domain